MVTRRLSCFLMLLLCGAVAHAESQADYKKFDPDIDKLLARMTLDEKIGQMMQPDQAFLKDPADVEKFFLGSLLSGGGSGPKDKSRYNLEGWTDLVDGYQKHALNTRLHIPLLYGVDAVHGHHNIPNATVFPHQIGMGCTRDAALVTQVERVTAEEVRATGINWVFAPCVTVPQDIRWGRTYEGFSDDPDLVKLFGAAAVRGFQGDSLGDPLAEVACVKHFVGDGGTAYGTGDKKEHALLDRGDTEVDEATLRRTHLPGYISAIAAGAATIMPSYSSWNGVKCSADKYLLTDLLKKELGFEGFIISDYNAIDLVSPDYKSDVATCINAGIDMVMMTKQYPQFYSVMHELVDSKEIPMSRIDDAVRRILRVKFAAGLMGPNPHVLADRNLWKSFGSPAHREVARRAVQESLVVLKNDGQTLPIATSRRICIAGRGADNVGMQCGGWTISWQGEMNQRIEGATSILAGFQKVAGDGAQVTYSADAANTANADVGVLVIGEEPYAEYRGDRAQLTLAEADVAAFKAMKASGIKVVVVLLSGRPIMLGDVLDQADAVVAAWLPGSEGEGVADVLLGKAKPTGKLSFNWPREVGHTPGGSDPDPLFKRGYGLTWEK
ncbi:MAG: glycoside hydrolase family 3 protein [Phycisphaerae bacterium]